MTDTTPKGPPIANCFYCGLPLWPTGHATRALWVQCIKSMALDA